MAILTNSLVECLERVGIDDKFVEIGAYDGVDIVATEAKGHLREVVGTETEELGNLGNLVGHEGGTRNLYHGAELVVEMDV